MFCVKCGTQLRPDARFCTGCGEPAGVSEPPKAPAADNTAGSAEQIRRMPTMNSEIPVQPYAPPPAPVGPLQGMAQSPPRKRIPKIWIALAIAAAVLVVVLAGAGIFISSLGPASMGGIAEYSLEEYVLDPENYDVGSQIQLNLDRQLLDYLLYTAQKEKRQELPFDIESLRSDPENDTIEVDARYGFIKLGINLTSTFDFDCENGSLVMNSKCKSVTFGKGKWELGFIEDKIPKDFFNIRIVFPHLEAQIRSVDTGYGPEQIRLTLEPDKTRFAEQLAALDDYLDESFLSILVDEPPDIRDISPSGLVFSADGLEPYLCQYTEKGLDKAFESFTLAAIAAGSGFETRIEDSKRKVFDAYIGRAQGYSYDLLDLYRDIYTDAVLLNGRVYSGFYADTAITVNTLSSYIGIPDGVRPESMSLLYDKDRASACIAFPYGSDSMMLVYENGDEAVFENLEYVRLFQAEPMPKGDIVTVMPGDTDRIPIQQAIRSYINTESLLYVRYIRADQKYAVAVVSPVNDKQNIMHFCLVRTGTDEWSVISRIYSEYDYRAIFTNPEYCDFNLKLIPLEGLNGYRQYNVETEDLRNWLEYQEWYGTVYNLPRLSSGKLCPIEIVTRIDNWIFFRFVTDIGETYIAEIDTNGDGWFTQLDSYSHLLEFLSDRGIPLFIGLQV